MDINVHLGHTLRARRRILGLSQLAVAKLVGVRFQQIQKYECGANRMSASRLWELSQALQMSVSEFFAGLNEEMRT